MEAAEHISVKASDSSATWFPTSIKWLSSEVMIQFKSCTTLSPYPLQNAALDSEKQCHTWDIEGPPKLPLLFFNPCHFLFPVGSAASCPHQAGHHQLPHSMVGMARALLSHRKSQRCSLSSATCTGPDGLPAQPRLHSTRMTPEAVGGNLTGVEVTTAAWSCVSSKPLSAS